MTGPKVARYGERDFQPIRLDQRAGAIRPFDQNRRALRGFFPAELGQFGERVDAIEIDVDHGKTRQVVKLQEGESRARNFEAFVRRQARE